MTVPAPGQLYSEYVADGLATERSIGFPLRRPADLRVEANGVLQVLGQHYAVTGVSPSQRIVPLAPFWPSGTTIAYWRQTARQQEYDIPAGVDLRNQSLEDELDRNQLQQQEQDAEIGRAVMAPRGLTPPTIDPTDLTEGDLLEFRNGELRRFDAAPFEGKFYAGAPGSGRPIPANGTGADIGLREDLAEATGADLIGRRTVTQLLADTSPARGAGAKWYADDFSYVEAASNATDHHLTTAGGIKLYVQPGEGGRADIRAFGCFLNGIADDTVAWQRAFDSGLPLSSPKGRLLLSDTILLEPGADFIGAGGVALYDDAALQIAFTPLTKRGVFRWRTDPGVGVEGSSYVFGCRLKGFCLRGFGPGAGMVLDLPHLYNGDFDFFCFAGVDGWIRLRRWMDTKVKGGVQGFRFFGVEFSGGGVYESDVTTTTTIDAYVSQGPIGYTATSRAVTDCKIKGTIESVDNACNIARGNVLHFDVYTENVPRTDAGSAWVYGKTGVAAAFETALHLNLRPGIGHSGGTLNNANLIDVDVARLVKVSGYTYLYRTLLKTTANTEKVLIEGLDTDNITAFSTPDGIADFSKIIMLGFTPRFMTQVPGGPFFIDGTAVLPSMELAEVDRSTVLPGQFFADKGRNGKVYRRDKFGNFSAPIGALRVAGTSAWTVQGGRLTPGELVQNSAVTPGEPGLWISTRFSKDMGNTYFLCSTTAGSPVVTSPTVGTFFLCEIGDFVTVSAGFDSATVQRRVIARAADLTSVTLDSNATSTVSGTVNVATEAHSLIPLAQQGHRTATADPTGSVTPFFVGEELLRTDNSTWYKSTGLTSADWKLLT